MFIHGLFSCGSPQQNWLLATAAAATKSLPEMPEIKICTRVSPRGTTSQPSAGVARAYSSPDREETPAGNRDNRYTGLMHNLQTKDRQSKKPSHRLFDTKEGGQGCRYRPGQQRVAVTATKLHRDRKVLRTRTLKQDSLSRPGIRWLLSWSAKPSARDRKLCCLKQLFEKSAALVPLNNSFSNGAELSLVVSLHTPSASCNWHQTKRYHGTDYFCSKALSLCPNY